VEIALERARAETERAIRVYTAWNDPEARQVKNEMLAACGFDVVGTAENGDEAVRGVLASLCDVLLADVFLSGEDGLDVCRRVKEKKRTLPVILLSPFLNGFLSYRLQQAKPDCLLILPVNSARLAEKIVDLVAYRRMLCANGSFDLDRSIDAMLKALGVPYSCEGFAEIGDALRLCFDDPTLSRTVTKRLYPLLGEKHGKTRKAVERNIRSAIEMAFDRSTPAVLERYFGNTVSAGRGRATNSEFLAALTQALRLEARFRCDP
jgi:two-component system response regulator (stage 0 sporulation protein A)